MVILSVQVPLKNQETANISIRYCRLWLLHTNELKRKSVRLKGSVKVKVFTQKSSSMKGLLRLTNFLVLSAKGKVEISQCDVQSDEPGISLLSKFQFYIRLRNGKPK